MNWEAVGAIAELVAALGVIASLIYLAKQINANSDNIAQNTKALVSDRDASSNDTAMDILNLLATDQDLAALMMKGGLDADVLSELESFRYSTFMLRIFEAHQTYFIQHQKGSVSEELWSYYSRVMDRNMRVSGISNWWVQNRSDFNSGFVAYINRKLSDDA